MMQTPDVGFMLIATGKYIQFVKPFISSAEKYFLPGYEKTYHIFTDQVEKPSYFDYPGANVILYCCEHLPFPLPTLLRFHRFLGQAEMLSHHTHICYADIDTLWVGEVKPEDVLSPLSATLHCGFIGDGLHGRRTDFDQNPKSLAYLPTTGAEGYSYYGGGFILATPEEYFKMAKWCAERINEDFKNNVIAQWHDESHLNKYLNTIKKPVKELTPSFHFAEYLQKNEEFKQKYPPKLLLLDKKHDDIRKIEYNNIATVPISPRSGETH